MNVPEDCFVLEAYPLALINLLLNCLKHLSDPETPTELVIGGVTRGIPRSFTTDGSAASVKNTVHPKYGTPQRFPHVEQAGAVPRAQDHGAHPRAALADQSPVLAICQRAAFQDGDADALVRKSVRPRDTASRRRRRPCRAWNVSRRHCWRRAPFSMEDGEIVDGSGPIESEEDDADDVLETFLAIDPGSKAFKCLRGVLRSPTTLEVQHYPSAEPRFDTQQHVTSSLYLNIWALQRDAEAWRLFQACDGVHPRSLIAADIPPESSPFARAARAVVRYVHRYAGVQTRREMDWTKYVELEEPKAFCMSGEGELPDVKDDDCRRVFATPAWVASTGCAETEMRCLLAEEAAAVERAMLFNTREPFTRWAPSRCRPSSCGRCTCFRGSRRTVRNPLPRAPRSSRPTS